jgi:hypothetical protein
MRIENIKSKVVSESKTFYEIRNKKNTRHYIDKIGIVEMCSGLSTKFFDKINAEIICNNLNTEAFKNLFEIVQVNIIKEKKDFFSTRRFKK